MTELLQALFAAKDGSIADIFALPDEDHEGEPMPKSAKTDLLCAVKPFLKGKRRQRVEQMIRLMALAELAGSLTEGKGDEGDGG